MLYGPNGLLQINYDSLKHCDGDEPVLDEPTGHLQLEDPVMESNIKTENCSFRREINGMQFYTLSHLSAHVVIL